MTFLESITIVHNKDNLLTTFKIQGQIYHQISSFLLISDGDTKFLRIYFIGEKEE